MIYLLSDYHNVAEVRMHRLRIETKVRLDGNSVIVAVTCYGKQTERDEQLPEVLDISQFFTAIHTSGRYPLFTCGCGVFGCGGYYVDVECTRDAWILKNRYASTFDPDNAPLIEECEYHIPWEDVKKAAHEIRDLLKISRQGKPGITISVGYVIDITEFSDVEIKTYA